MKLVRLLCLWVVVFPIACSTKPKAITTTESIMPTTTLAYLPSPAITSTATSTQRKATATSIEVISTPTQTPRPGSPTPSETPATPPPSPVAEATFQGYFSNQAALRALYPDPRIVVSDLRVQLPALGYGRNLLTDTLTIILSEAYWEDQQMKHAVILASDRNQNEVHSDGAPLTGAIFVLENDAWRLETAQGNFAELGSWGFPPRAHVVQIGPQKYGIIFESDFWAWGAFERSLYLFAVINGQIRQLLMLTDIRAEAADLMHEGQRELIVASDYRFVESRNPNYYDFQISYWGNGVDSPLYEQHTYVFKETGYVEP